MVYVYSRLRVEGMVYVSGNATLLYALNHARL